MAFTQYLLGWLVFLSASLPLTVMAQVVPDETLGAENSRVRRAAVRGREADLIEGGAARGRNLFHSFQEFGVREGDAAYFANPATIENIFSRVTGSNPSNILGTLGVDGAANLFLMNPNGILFGPNASLDVSGSFVGTTANAIGFGNQGFFSATNPELPSQLLTVNPSAFFFNQIPTGDITVRSRTPIFPEFGIAGLLLDLGENLSLLGGNVNVEGGRLNAFGGRIDIGAVSGNGTIGLNPDGSFAFPTDVQRGDVIFTDAARADVRTFDSGGDLAITAGTITLTDESALLAGILPGQGSSTSQAGDITLDATGSIRVQQDSQIVNDVRLGATGNAGDLNIIAQSLFIDSGAQLSTSTFGQGDADSFLMGDAGSVLIRTRTLALTDGAVLTASTRGVGDAGSVFIDATESVSLSDAAILSTVEQGGVGANGTVDLTTRTLVLTDGTLISADTFGAGNAGNVRIQDTETITLNNNSAITTAVRRNADGQGGDIELETNQLRLNDSVISSSTAGTGNTGRITINAS